MSLPQYVWDVIRKDPRFLATTPEAQRIFIQAARQWAWNTSPKSATTLFRKGLTEAFGPLTTPTPNLLEKQLKPILPA